MSDEYDSSNVYYSPFWPLAIVLAAFIFWLGYQIYGLNAQRMAMNSQVQQMEPTLRQAQIAQQQLVALMSDIADTSKTDRYAKEILQRAINAGLVRVNPNANATATAPASDSATDTSGK
ncbi:MAG TPA: hypothetical protein VL981_04780 [Candidatus Methylacidiphilales bacterium]|nr:hypothetical protein [Candidatus Methylacidiphilales bacterium]